MSIIADLTGSAAGQIVAGVVALSLFFGMADYMISGQQHEQAQLQKSGYQTCMQHSSEEYCSTIYPE